MALTEERCAAPGCTNLSTRNGEHVIPDSLMRALIRTVWTARGYAAASTSHGVEAESEQPMFIKLPCCAHHNSILSQNFEDRGQKAAKRFLGITSTGQGNRRSTYAAVPLESVPALDPGEAAAFGRWIIKTLLLMHHPKVVWEMNGIRRHEDQVSDQRAYLPEHVFADLFAGVVPRGCHAWVVASKDQGLTAPGPVVRPRVALRTIAGIAEVASTFGIGARRDVDEFTVQLQAVWQPDAIVVHPDEESGVAVRMWPRQPRAGLRLGDLDVLSLDAGAQFTATFSGEPTGWFDDERTAVLAEGLRLVSCSNEASGHRFYALPRLDDRARVDTVRAFAETAGLLETEAGGP